MKKIYTLATLLVVALSLNAQNYRKWDFTNWSAQTINNLTVEAELGVTGGTWSDTEKANGDNPQVGNCYWSYGENVIDGELAANGAVINETEGLIFNTSYTSRRSLAIAVNYPETSLGTYAGPQYLWLGGGNAKSASARIWCFKIPKVRVGQKITIVAESHKPSDARGVGLYAGDCTNDALLIGEQFKPTTQATYTWEEGWTLPEGATLNDDGETVDIQVYNTNGCHLYSIEIGDNTQKSKIAYIYEGSTDNEIALPIISQNDNNDIVTMTAEEFTAKYGADFDAAIKEMGDFNALVISSSVQNDEFMKVMKSLQPFVPTLSLNPAVYAAWGYGTVSQAQAQFILATQPNHQLFRGLTLIENPDNDNNPEVIPFTQADTFPVVALAGLFADDTVLGYAMGSEDVAIHAHNLSHNGYLFIPYTNEVMATIMSPELITNAVKLLINSRAKVTQAPNPTISLEYKDMATVVSIKSGVTGARIFYTLDGTEPTAASQVYTEPFTITDENITVKAVALGDGYLLSDVTEQLVDLKPQAAAPTISLAAEEGKTTVTITTNVEGGTIYYNFSGKNIAAQSKKYEQPLTLTNGRIIYAFVEAEGMLASEVTSQNVTVQGEEVRIDVIAHMDANSTEYNQGSTSTKYFFSWGRDKAAYAYYNEEVFTDSTYIDEYGDEQTVKIYSQLNPEEEVDFGNGWAIRSRGQIVDWENLTTGDNIGDNSGYNYADVEDVNPDFAATKGIINLADKNTKPDNTSFPYNAYIVTTKKYQGPFNVVANVGSITKPEAEAKHEFVIEVSTDGNVWESEWTVLGDTCYMENSGRLTHNFVRSYEGTDEVYVRAYLSNLNSKIGFYDIYLANNGEKSQERANGIEDNTTSVEVRPVAYYNLNGVRQSGLNRGINIVRYSDGTARKIMVK